MRVSLPRAFYARVSVSPLTNPVFTMSCPLNYTVEISSDGGSTWSNPQTVNHPSASYSYSGLAPGTYRARIRANYSGGSSEWIVSGSITLSPTLTTFISGTFSSNLRNDFTGGLGCRFSFPTNRTVYELGRIWLTGNTGSGTIQIRRTSDNSLIATATINLSSGTNNQFNWTAITPVTLSGGVEYNLYTIETSGGNLWREIGVVTTTGGTIADAIFSANPATGFNGVGFPETTYGPVNLKYA